MPPSRGRRVAVFLSAAAAGLTFLILLIWLIGRVASDRWTWSQYLLWIPEELLLACAVLPWLLAWPLARVSKSPGARRLSRVAALSCALLAAHLLLVHWRLTNCLTRSAPGSGAFRILNWNVTAVDKTEEITGTLAPQHPDVVVLVDVSAYVQWPDVFADFGQPQDRVWVGQFLILSRFPIIRHGRASLGIEGAMTGDGRAVHFLDPGSAMYLELD